MEVKKMHDGTIMQDEKFEYTRVMDVSNGIKLHDGTIV